MNLCPPRATSRQPDMPWNESPPTVLRRWSGLGPYYAMFPTNFAFEVVREFCPADGAVLDPFAGRGTSVFAAAATGRRGVGIEINPVGWLYGKTKLRPANPAAVLRRLNVIGVQAQDSPETITDGLPPFFQSCYADRVLKFLIVARRELQWKLKPVDTTLMAIILVHLHGKRSDSLSNQLRQSKAMSPDYCIRWWTQRQMEPPEIDPVDFLQQRLKWRYSKGIPMLAKGEMILGDSTKELRGQHRSRRGSSKDQFDLLFTSPPYWNVTNYNYDQWLRLWMLGSMITP